MRRGLLIAALAAAVVAIAVTAGVVVAVRQDQARLARLAAIDAAELFVDTWQAGDWERLSTLTTDPGAGQAHAEAADALGVVASTVELTGVDFETVPGEAVGSYAATFSLAGLGQWRYEGSFELISDELDWAVDWAPSTLHPELGPGDRLQAERHWPVRARLLDRHGDELGGPLAVVAGDVGEATADQLAELGEPYQAGDVAGQSGLQRSLERRLAGAPGGTVRVVTGEGEPVATLQEYPVTEPADVRTTLDLPTQEAGRIALAPIGPPAALVAIDVPSGAVRAVVNNPATGFDRALSGRYPPGSTFKVVTTAALLESGLDPAATVGCPGTASIGGRSFRNAGFSALGPVSFREAFAESCNTAFVVEADRLPAGALASAARLFGFDVDYDAGVPVAHARFPDPIDAVEHAAAALGQGRVEATPLHMASVAAAVARGHWVAPRLLVDMEAGPTDGPLPAAVVAELGDLMRHAVEEGTGTAAQVGGEPVAGKTGTAEFGTTGAATHAWFIAFRGDLALAVLVEGGGFGGEVAAPAAARFYSALD